MTHFALPTVIVRTARPDDRPAVERLLALESLPLAGVAEHFDGFLVAIAAAGVVGAIGLETYGEDALLRSAVVEAPARGRGIGALLTTKIIDRARERGVKTVYLLTVGADDYFAAAGFERIGREAVAPALSASAELSGACPAEAVFMRRTLG